MSNLRLAFASVAGNLLETLAATFRTLRGGDIRKLGYETFVVNGDGYMALRHHGTDIVKVERTYPDMGGITTDTVTLNASGYRSVTTADRMRRLFYAAGIPVQVYVQGADYTVSTPNGHYEYRDGMSFRVLYSRDGHISIGSMDYPKRAW